MHGSLGPNSTLDFLSGGGEMADRIRTYNWAGTAIGPIVGWPQSLKTTISIMLRSPVPMVLLWGPEGVMVYNDGYTVFAGGRHPQLLGSPVLEGWPEVADFNAHVMQVGLAGGTLSYKDQELTLHRKGIPEQVWMNLDYSPVLDESGRPAGVLAIVVETTDRVLAERRTASEAERQRRLFEQMPGFVGVLTGPNHVYEYVNEAYVTISGPRAFVGRSVREVFPELEGQGFYELLDQVYATGETFSARAMPIRLTGEDAERFIDLLYQPIRDEKGSVTGILVGGYDITERVRAEQGLRDSEARLRVLAEATSDVLYRMSPDWGEMRELDGGGFLSDTTDPNRAWLLDYIPVNEQQRVTAAIDAAIRDKSIFELEHQVVRTDGTPGWTLSRAVPILDEDCGIIEWFGAASDVTQRREATESLRELNATLEARVEERTAERDRMWDTSPDLMLVSDFEGVFRRVNPAWTTILAYAPDELVGHHVNEFVVPDDHESTVNAYEMTARGKQSTIENRYRHKDGSIRWISWVAAPAGDVTYSTGRDVTLEKEREAELAKAQEALRQSQKMEAVGQLTGGLAHDFNNLLAGISGSLELMQTRMQQGRVNDVDRYMAAAQGAAKRAAALTHRLLAFSRRQTLDPKPTNVNRLVSGMEELVRRTVGPAIDFEFVGAAGLWPALVDPPQPENALLNLCINARDAMPDGGRITIETANRWLDERAARLHDMPEGQYLS
jgi:PAS domain S-box-containing protein